MDEMQIIVSWHDDTGEPEHATFNWPQDKQAFVRFVVCFAEQKVNFQVTYNE
jgi:hypothetical protein